MENLNQDRKKIGHKSGLEYTNSENQYDLIVFCHLRWDFVYQRPQQIISRMAVDKKILFVEEPIAFVEGGQEEAIFIEITPQLHVLKPKVACIEHMASLLTAYLGNVEFPIGWFYSAAFIPLLDKLKFDIIIYECMDELSLFKDAPQRLIDQEEQLMEKADVIFTGGKSLYESKRKMHSRVFCFPSSVDEAHFTQALNGIDLPEDIKKIKGPIVGYYGVIDERIDFELLRNVAAILPEISFVMIGPLAKIQDSELPRLANIHYLGMKSYKELPAYLKAFDITMMPFALNDATKFISPAKTLEFMAAGKPIISTKIKDVVSEYSHCVLFVETVGEFCDAILESLSCSIPSTIAYSTILNDTSWDTTTAKMNSIIKNFHEKY